MKKIFYILIMMVFSSMFHSLSAQEEVGTIGDIWSYPVIYNYDEEVTWYFDLSTTSFSPEEEVYIWIWSPSEPDAGNWENSSEFAHLTNEGNMIWSFTLTPTEYFSMTAEDIAASAGFWFRLKDQAGTKQTDVANVSYTPFNSFYTADEMIRSYPTEPTFTDGLSILFNSNLVAGFEDATSVHFHSGLNDWEVLQEYQAWIPEIVEKTKLKDLGNGFYKMDLIPNVYYDTAPDGYIMNNIVFLFVKDDWAGTSPNLVLNAAEYVPPPPAEFRYFPMQISQKDIFGLIRVNNEQGVNALNYTITGGSTTLTGQFTGGVSEIKGFVDLATGLQNEANLNQIHVVVTDNLGNTISDTIITLKTLD
ncbi:hypothetical protein [Mangrovimonas sp. ST2L15]|uniref:hypothetical protein n=1 Tax=Mangrovimonas sp. ST2L15 TaxID=1645916 RepID=UPI0006B5DB66|nr:hypothetical protein [Mangrovimonas sp. ST2L15]